ncbi:MAG: phosphoribosylformimino-5-aminoimidazole carboxamide ribotide isomerase [Ruminococcus sp.]|nr:phosphoribosylformimino-5-aminoimidazole carboxamide ribotide isomerase [Ruminococcus sp.]
MRFRPCIDIHNGKVKQIVGGSLRDAGSFAAENFVSEQDGGYYGRLYRSYGLTGGHIILLNPAGTEEYEADCAQAALALEAFPGGLQLGGGITAENAGRFLEAGASHVIVTSYVFKDGRISERNLERLLREVGRERLVLDLSCRRRGEEYFIVTDRWQKFTDTLLNESCIREFSAYCAELLVHAVDVEGKAGGIEEDVASLLGSSELPATYAGGIRSFEDLDRLFELGGGRVDFTVGSALDIFGGDMPFEQVVRYAEERL